MKISNVNQGSDEWHEERHGCVTGTKIESAIGASHSSAKSEWGMGGILWEFDGDKLIDSGRKQTASQIKTNKNKQQTLIDEIVSDIQSGLEIDDYQSAAMQRGHDLEPVSIKAASIKHSVLFETCGMLLSSTLQRFKYSPDAVCFERGIVVGGYETKSKMGSTHIKYSREKRVPPEHLMQCLCPMIMDDCVKWWIFGHYDDRNKINSLFTTGIKRADYEEFITVARKELSGFFAKVDETVRELGGEYHG